jgi:hypothetical protein
MTTMREMMAVFRERNDLIQMTTKDEEAVS